MIQKLKNFQKYLLKQKSARQIAITGPRDHSPVAVWQEINYLTNKSTPKMWKNRLFSLLELANAELPLKKCLPRSKFRFNKILGEFTINIFDVCLESFGTPRTLRNHLRTFWEHLEAILRTLKKIIFLKFFSNFLALQAWIFAWKCLILAIRP